MHGTGANGVTPFALCRQMVAEAVKPATTILDPACGKGSFLLAAIRHLIISGVAVQEAVSSVYGIDNDQSQIDHARINISRATGYIPRLECINSLDWETNMIFDVIIGNPPYQGRSQLHQQFFNHSVDLLSADGQLVFVQPAVVYFNKKQKTGRHSQIMRDNVQKYTTSVSMVTPTVFGTAENFNDLSITHLIKTPTTEQIETISYIGGTQYHTVDLRDITMTKMEPTIYRSIADKYMKYVNDHGSLWDVATTDPVKKANITKIRGHPGQDDWYTFIPKHKKYWVNTGNYGIPGETDEEVQYIYTYLTTTFARFGLALFKFAGDLWGSVLQGVPLVPFDKEYTDTELFDMIGLTPQERDAIIQCLPDYYARHTS
jgi:predicted RNA methylase